MAECFEVGRTAIQYLCHGFAFGEKMLRSMAPRSLPGMSDWMNMYAGISYADLAAHIRIILQQ